MGTHSIYPGSGSPILVLALVLAACGGPVGTGESSQRIVESSSQDPVIGELLDQLSLVEEKVLGLADTFEQAEYDWRPDEGVRSGAEVFMHLTTMNFVFPIFAGHAAPVSMGLTMENIATAAPALEGSFDAKVDILPQLGNSFAHLRTAIESTTAEGLEDEVTVFGNPSTVRAFWMDHVGHLREHMGQLIAYSRTNGVAPPWS